MYLRLSPDPSPGMHLGTKETAKSSSKIGARLIARLSDAWELPERSLRSVRREARRHSPAVEEPSRLGMRRVTEPPSEPELRVERNWTPAREYHVPDEWAPVTVDGRFPIYPYLFSPFTSTPSSPPAPRHTGDGGFGLVRRVRCHMSAVASARAIPRGGEGGAPSSSPLLPPPYIRRRIVLQCGIKL